MENTAPATAVLVARRKAAVALNKLVREVIGLGTMGEVFQGDVDEDWACIDQTTIRAIRHGRLVAEVTFDGDVANIELPDARNLANLDHYADFEPAHFGFGPQKMNWRGDKEPYEFKIALPDEIPGIHAPKRVIPREAIVSKVEVRRML